MSERNFFDMAPKQSLFFGLITGIAVMSLAANAYFLSGGQSLSSSKSANTGSQAAVNTNPTPTPAPTPEPGGDFSKVPAVTNNDHIRGDKNAKITMIEYSDFQCPFCQRHAPTMAKVLEDYQGKVRLVYRHFPLTSIHPQAQKSAEASECASEQGKFWEYHDLLFANQSALDITSLKSYAKQLSLNQGQFDQCLDSGKYTAKVNKGSAEAQASGITGTPGTWVGDQLVKGAYPYDTFKQIIDGLLK
ncbi:MAG: hypothetical protein A2729_03090 [Candidatus Buchananbacteria bacterium RIFCSPHIGHO2_01_FULL_39_14]|uniref:Thioredoxin domain-containing protein n=2 Tax=Candidatus Buchananiibacteriota TaxID=1817903 RepID=A0A1G1YUD1_9BACT|nr:MAG: hypothetical protein A2729_03090 [Candidatus Buchananbacteria bacterium RIFCSPHIGHO2_01_FULL_39_14]OGY49016.1 MAG: hypothetical protein A3D39_01435 [Candidatus Buchananbacteria bacterium RIFCSPHIGHO2_02_FULL_39_17]OGY55978.1 MAG: hypothetical protein A2912_03280 [Candidatus Buchananbacteria bacterium RIFCSPLOWO2_01_FULL_40_23b]